MRRINVSFPDDHCGRGTNFGWRAVVTRFLILLGGLLPFGGAHAQTYPAKPVRFIVIVATGGGLDATARFIAARLVPKLGQQVIVENRVGAGGNIAAQYVAHSPPDGYTLLLTSNGHTLNPLIYATPGYDPQKDFVPVMELTEGPVVLVTQPNAPFKTLKDVVDAAQAKPDSLSYAHGGLGLPPHIAMEMFKQAANVEIVSVAYKGAGPAVQDVLGGHIPLAMLSLAGATPHIAAGRLRALVSSGATRWPTLPEVPTMIEMGYPDVVYLNWQGILAPAGTPPEIVARLQKEIAAVLAEADVKEFLNGIGAAPVASKPTDFESMLKADDIANQKIVSKLKLKVD
jgi:tripartite-type tricarboxylate transporter receptor subunit TctC